MSEENEINQNLELIRQAILTLDKKIEDQNMRIAQLEQRSNSSQVFAETPSRTVVPLSPPLPPPPSVRQVVQESHASVGEIPKAPEKPEDANTLEENIGGKWFARIGIAALVIGISFFLKYAFDNDWIGETGRVIIGVFAGLILLALGEKTIRKYPVYGQIISGGGIAVLYLSIFAAFNFYHLMGVYAAFFVMAIITTIGIVLSVRYDALSLMTIAIVGGFATPLMLSTGQNNQISLLSYVALLDLAILAVSVFKKWRWINIIGFLGTILLFSLWGEQFYTDKVLGTTMIFLTLFFFIYSISSLIYNLVKKEKSTGVEQVLTLFSAIAYFSASFALLNEDYHFFMGFFALILAVYYFLWAFMVRTITPEDDNLYGFLAFLTVAFVTLMIPIQFEQNIITIGWAIEAVLLMIVGIKSQKLSIGLFSIIVWVLTLSRYFISDISRYDHDVSLIFNKVFFTAIVIIIAAYATAFVIKKFSQEWEAWLQGKTLIALFVIVANLITIFSISREITASYDREIRAINISQNEVQKSFPSHTAGKYGSYDAGYYSSDAYKASRDKIEKLENKSSISLSIFWIIYSIILLAVGIVGKYKGVRIGGLALLLLAILKLFFVDLWNLGTLYRIISSISLGVVLLAISFVYQKYKDKLREII
jgi:uncharacterized membrane protein